MKQLNFLFWEIKQKLQLTFIFLPVRIFFFKFKYKIVSLTDLG